MKFANKFWMMFSPRGQTFVPLVICMFDIVVFNLKLLHLSFSQFLFSLERGGSEVGKNIRLLQLQLRESEHLEEKVGEIYNKRHNFRK